MTTASYAGAGKYPLVRIRQQPQQIGAFQQQCKAEVKGISIKAANRADCGWRVAILGVRLSHNHTWELRNALSCSPPVWMQRNVPTILVEPQLAPNIIEANQSSTHHALTHLIFRAQSSLSERLHQLHADLLETVPVIDRIGCALYDPDDDLLKTFINSTRSGTAIAQYEYQLADSKSLSDLAKHGMLRIIDDIQQAIKPANEHSKWVLDQGYRSSFTAPMYHNGAVLGFIFFDSLLPGAFNERVQRDVLMSVNLINMTISTEMSAIRSILASAKVAREFSDLRDFETGAHIERMARYSRLIAKAVAGKFGLDDEFVEQIFLFAPLHDIGKIGIPDRILLKPGRLDPDERRLMETHVVKGVEIIEKIIGDFELKQLPGASVMKNIVLAHHEYLNGSGYPNGLKGEEVPVEARIVTVADIFDALISARPYKEAWTIEAACEELERMASLGKLDADCVAVIGTHAAEFVAINMRYQDPAPVDARPAS